MNVIRDRQVVVEYLMDNFKYSYETAIVWINAANANFGLCSPEDLINAGRVDKVMLFLIAAKEGC